MRALCAAVLSLQAIVLGLTTPVMIAVAGVDTRFALAAGLGLAVLALVVAGSLRRPWAYWLGHAVQVAAISLGFVLPVMFLLGAVFAALWVTALLLGRRVDEIKAGRGLPSSGS